MDTGKVYIDITGDKCTIHQMVKREPGWAANRIQDGEVAIARLRLVTLELTATLKTLELMYNNDAFEHNYMDKKLISDIITRLRSCKVSNGTS